MEEPWNDEHEKFLKNVRKEAYKQAKDHKHCGFTYQCWYNLFGLPTVIIPILMTPFNMIFAQQKYDDCDDETQIMSTAEYINAFSFLVIGIFTSITQFFKFAERYQLHFQFENVYNDIKTDIDTELVKSRKFRSPCDVFIAKIQMRMDHADKMSPVIHKNTCCVSCCYDM